MRQVSDGCIRASIWQRVHKTLVVHVQFHNRLQCAARVLNTAKCVRNLKFTQKLSMNCSWWPLFELTFVYVVSKMKKQKQGYCTCTTIQGAMKSFLLENSKYSNVLRFGYYVDIGFQIKRKLTERGSFLGKRAKRNYFYRYNSSDCDVESTAEMHGIKRNTEHNQCVQILVITLKTHTTDSYTVSVTSASQALFWVGLVSSKLFRNQN